MKFVRRNADAIELGTARGALILWVLPPLVILAALSYWYATPRSVPVASHPVQPKASQASVAKAASASSTASAATETEPRPASEQKVAVPVAVSSPTGVAERTGVEKPADSPALKVDAVKVVDRSPEDIARILVGEWTGSYQGQRRLKVTADGKGTMIANPEGLAAALLAAELKFDIRWAVKGEQLEFETIGGEPLDKVNVVVRMYGRVRSHKMLELQADTMLLLDEDGVTKYLWKRVTSEAVPDATAK